MPTDPSDALRRTQTFCLVALTTMAAGFSLYFLQSVVLPFVIALFMVSGIRPILDFLERRLHLHWTLAFAVAFLAGILLLALFSFLTWYSINDLSKNSAEYSDRIDSVASWIGQQLPDPEGAGSDEEDPVTRLLEALGLLWRQLIVNLAGVLTSLLSYGVLILIFVFFLLLGRADGPKYRPKLVEDMDNQIRKYIIMKTVISFFTGAITAIVLWAFNVPLAIVFGMLAFLLNFIPNIGPLISNILPVPFLVLNPQISPTSAVICFLLISAIQFISGNVVETRIMGKSFDVHPIVLLLSLMFFGLVWGIVGMFLATPIISVVKIALYQHESSRPIAELLAGRWTPRNPTLGEGAT